MDLDTQLKLSSRSFYLSLNVVPQAIRQTLGLGYHLCRLVDTLVDTDLLPVEERLKAVLEFRQQINAFPVAKDRLMKYAKDLNNQLPLNASIDRKILSHLDVPLALFAASPRTDQVLIQKVVVAVTMGMEMDLTLQPFSMEKQLEDYIHFIGGEPGRFWTDLCLHYFPKLPKKDRVRFLEAGIAFGRGVQMINILRDIPRDLKNGRCYIPQALLQEYGLTVKDFLTKEKRSQFLTLYHRLIKDTVGRLHQGVDYLEQIPRTEWRLRAAVWWPLALGLKTLNLLQHSEAGLDGEKPAKLKKSSVYGVLGLSPIILAHDKLVQWEFIRLSEH